MAQSPESEHLSSVSDQDLLTMNANVLYPSLMNVDVSDLVGRTRCSFNIPSYHSRNRNQKYIERQARLRQREPMTMRMVNKGRNKKLIKKVPRTMIVNRVEHPILTRLMAL